MISRIFHHSQTCASKLPRCAASSPRIQSFIGKSPRRHISTSKSIMREARIVCIADPKDEVNKRIYEGDLPPGAKFIAVGYKNSDFDVQMLRDQNVNVIYCAYPKASGPLSYLLTQELPVRWIHTTSTGLDNITSPALTESKGHFLMTNAKGTYSSTLAEYAMMAVSYFAKDVFRLMQNKTRMEWELFGIQEIRGKTIGIVGYGDIGRAVAKLAKAYSMRVIAMKRRPPRDADPLCDEVYFGTDQNDRKEALHKIMKESDYIVNAAPLTPETENMFDKEAFANAKNGSVFINVGRGQSVDEQALIEALKDETRGLRGAGLDVFVTEPLPRDSDFWKMDNVLLSPHNMYQQEVLQAEADFFVDVNLPRFLKKEEMLNMVDKSAGY